MLTIFGSLTFINAILMFFSFIVTALVAYYARKVFVFVGDRKLKLFAYAFGVMSVGYFFASFNNLLRYWLEVGNCPFLTLIRPFVDLWLSVGNMFFIVPLLAGLVTLAYMAAGCKKESVYFLLLSFAGAALVLSPNKFLALSVFAAGNMAFLMVYYVRRLMKDWSVFTSLVLTSFSIWFGATLLFFHANVSGGSKIAPRLLIFVSHAVLLFALVMVVRKK